MTTWELDRYPWDEDAPEGVRVMPEGFEPFAFERLQGGLSFVYVRRRVPLREQLVERLRRLISRWTRGPDHAQEEAQAAPGESEGPADDELPMRPNLFP